MTLSFFGFFRVSELLNLKKKDIVYDSQTNKLNLPIRFSKTDQEGKRITTYIYKLCFIILACKLMVSKNLFQILNDLFFTREN